MLKSFRKKWPLALAAALILFNPVQAAGAYVIDISSDGKNQVDVQPSQIFTVDLRLNSDAADRIDLAQFRMIVSHPGLTYEGYTWSAPFVNHSFEDDSAPLAASLPISLNALTLSGPGFPKDVVDFQLSNITDLSSDPVQFFTSGSLVRMRFSAPDFGETRAITFGMAPEAFSNGFIHAPIAAINELSVTIVPEPGVAVLSVLGIVFWAALRVFRAKGGSAKQ